MLVETEVRKGCHHSDALRRPKVASRCLKVS